MWAPTLRRYRWILPSVYTARAIMQHH
jgi:hypothetical protein